MAALAGERVRLYEDPAFAEGFAHVRATGAIELTAPGGKETPADRRGVARLEHAGHDLAETLRGVRVINVVTATAGHPAMFDALVPLLGPEHMVVVWAGRFGGARLAARLDGARGPNPLVAEVNSLPFGARLTGPGAVSVLYWARRLFVGARPAARVGEVLEALRPWCPTLAPTRDLLSAAFRNSALVVYPAGALFNAGRVEHAGGDFYMFREGITPAVARVIRALYGELECVGRALGLDVESYPDEAFAPPHSIEAREFTDPAAGSAALDSLRGPTSIPTRYLYENLRDALPVVVELGRVAGVATPGLEAMIRLGGLLSGEDFWAARAGLATLNLAGLGAAALRARLTGAD